MPVTFCLALLLATGQTLASELPSCKGFSKGDFSGDVTDKDICRTACEKAEGFCCPDFKGEATKAKYVWRIGHTY